MVREIAARSCGAQIKIYSDKEQEKELQDCIVTIAGSLANKQDAACIILEQIEEFKVLDVRLALPSTKTTQRSLKTGPSLRSIL
jgi:hypothetical protein